MNLGVLFLMDFQFCEVKNFKSGFDVFYKASGVFDRILFLNLYSKLPKELPGSVCDIYIISYIGQFAKVS